MKLQFDLNRDEIFEKLLNGELSDSEKAQVIEAINNDERLKKEFAITQAIHSHYKTERRNQLKQSLVDLENQSQECQPRKKGIVLHLKRIAVIAACLTGVIFLGKMTLSSKPTHQDLYADHFEAYPNVYNPIVRSHQSNTLSIDSQIMSFYEQQEFHKSIELYNEHYTFGEKENELNFYMAISYMKVDNIEKAKSILVTIPESSKYYEKSKWYLALCYLNENNLNEFTRIANTLVYKKDVAEEIIESLQ